jgi:hypothetical protein
VAIVAHVAVASTAWALGVLSTSDWLAFLNQALCLIGVFPLVSALAVQVQLRPHMLAAAVITVACCLGLVLSSSAGVFLVGLAPDASPPPLGLGSAVLIALLSGGLAVWLTPAGELEAAPVQPERPQSKAAAPPRLGVARFLHFYVSPRPEATLASLYVMVLGAQSYYTKGLLWSFFIPTWFYAYLAPLPVHLPISRARILAYFLVPIALVAALAFWIEYSRTTCARSTRSRFTRTCTAGPNPNA